MTTTRLEGITLEVLAGGAAEATTRLEGIALEVLYRPPPGEVRVTHLQAMVLGTLAETEGAAAVTQEHVQFSGTEDPSVLHVTHEAVSLGTTDDPSEARVTHLYVQVLMDNIPPPPELPKLHGCDLLLEVFNDDRETVRWNAATRLDFSNPYLVMPERYAEQEIDVASGSASLGTVTVTVVDVPNVHGEQWTGFMTSKLSRLATADLHGRRARLLRAIGEDDDQILEVVIDGVAGNPRMDQSYAAFGFEIRDTREVERKVRAFSGFTEASMAFLPTGDNGHLGVLSGYGYNAEDNTYLLQPIVAGLTGTFSSGGSEFPHASTGRVNLTGNSADLRTMPIKAYHQMDGQMTEHAALEHFARTEWARIRFPNLQLWWRANPSADPWTVIDGAHLIMDVQRDYLRYNPGVVTTDLSDDLVRIDWIAFGDDRIAPADPHLPVYSPVDPEASLPAIGQNIELMIVSYAPPSTDAPLHVEGLTAGEFAKNVYDGVYSARDAEGAIVPTGILYDADAVLAMTDPVRLRITEPIKDARDWLEKYIYAPTGWVPALDVFGRISPVSQEAPDDIFSLPLIHDAITEPQPTWNSGERIVNIVRFTYPRDYLPTDPDDAETGDGLAAVDSVQEYQDPGSIDRHGEQVLELDGRAFRALGTETGDPALLEGITGETGWQLASERGQHVLNRYSLGAPTMTVNVRRAYTPDLRAGSWVRVWLSWFPDYVTGERGLIALCQIVAIGDLDCVWRQVTMEQVTPLTLYDVDEELRTVLLTGKTGKFLTGKSGLPLTSIL